MPSMVLGICRQLISGKQDEAAEPTDHLLPQGNPAVPSQYSPEKRAQAKPPIRGAVYEQLRQIQLLG
jgi:hypothetical protein